MSGWLHGLTALFSGQPSSGGDALCLVEDARSMLYAIFAMPLCKPPVELPITHKFRADGSPEGDIRETG